MGVVAANGATSGASIFFMVTGAAVALAVGAVRVSGGDMELRPLLIVLMLGVEVFRPMRELTNLYHQGMTVLSSAQSVFGIIDQPVSIRESKLASGNRPLPDIRPEVSFDGVTFGYEGGHRPALEGVSFDLRRGETLGVVGASGAGKSTLVWLMYRFYDPQAGSIKLGGHDLRDLPLSVVRDNISVVTQDTYLFHGTVAENLLFGKPDATRAELEAAARAANAHEFISHLPHGYETVVGERAVRLSGGQRQRLAIARALLKDAPDPVAGRGAVQCGRRERVGHPGRARQADGEQDDAGHRPPAFQRHKRRPHPGPRRRPGRGSRYSRRAYRRRRNVRRPDAPTDPYGPR